jgi:hypothetical protein
MSEDLEKCAKEMEAAAELEMEREHYLREYEEEMSDIVAGDGEVIKRTPLDHSPGSFSFHEAFHMSSVIYGMFEQHIISDAAVFTDRELFEEAAKVRDALWDFYQKMGAKHL